MRESAGGASARAAGAAGCGCPRSARVQQAGAARAGRGRPARREPRAWAGTGRLAPAAREELTGCGGPDAAPGKRAGGGQGWSCPGSPLLAGRAAGLVPVADRPPALEIGGVARGLGGVPATGTGFLAAAAAPRRDGV